MFSYNSAAASLVVLLAPERASRFSPCRLTYFSRSWSSDDPRLANGNPTTMTARARLSAKLRPSDNLAPTTASNNAPVFFDPEHPNCCQRQLSIEEYLADSTTHRKPMYCWSILCHHTLHIFAVFWFKINLKFSHAVKQHGWFSPTSFLSLNFSILPFFSHAVFTALRKLYDGKKTIMPAGITHAKLNRIWPRSSIYQTISSLDVARAWSLITYNTSIPLSSSFVIQSLASRAFSHNQGSQASLRYDMTARKTRDFIRR